MGHMSPRRAYRWVSTPAEGRILDECRIHSKGKRSEITITFADGGKLFAAMGERAEFVSLGGVHQTLRALDDVWVELLVTPLVPGSVVIEVAKVWHDGDPEFPLPKEADEYKDVEVVLEFQLGFGLVAAGKSLAATKGRRRPR